MIRLSIGFAAADLLMLGKLNPNTLTDQQMLELLVVDMNAVHIFQDKEGNFLQYIEWPNIDVHENSIIEIRWETTGAGHIDHEMFRGTGGSIDLRWIPDQVESFEASGLMLHGSIKTVLLPRNLLVLCVQHNELSGTFETIDLPSCLQTLLIHENNLIGTFEFTKLPRDMVHLLVHGNSF